jgi:hypothetical protein
VRSSALGLLIVIALAGCGAGTQTVTTVETVTQTVSATTPTSTLLPADPSMPARCTPEPDQPPVCTQGNYQVQPPVLGSSCDGTGDVWEWNQAFDPRSDLVCAKPDPSHLHLG